MSEIVILGLSAFFICFTVATFFLSRIPFDIYPEEYEFKLDPFWYIWGIMLIGSVAIYTIYPYTSDAVKSYDYFDVILPFVLSALIYFCYLTGIASIANIVILLCSIGVVFTQKSDLVVFDTLPYWQDRLLISLILFTITRGFVVVNGLGATACMQFCTVLISTLLLAYFGVVPMLLVLIAAVYLGVMVAYGFFSWPPEKLVVTNGGYSALGFILAYFMMNMSIEHSEVSMFIASSYLFTEIGISLYNRFIMNEKYEQAFMYTSYYKLSNEGEHESYVVTSLIKLFIVNIVLSCMQLFTAERIALPFFAVALNFWVLSLISGDSKLSDVFSITRYSIRGLGKVLNKNKNKKETTQTKQKRKRKKAD